MEKDAIKSKSSRQTLPYYPELPTAEVYFNYLLWFGGVVGSVFTLSFLPPGEIHKYSAYGYLEEGWQKWIGRYKDTSDFEWSFWERFLWPVVIIGFTGHFVVARLAEIVCPNHRFKVYLAYSTVFTVLFLRIQGLLYMLGHFLLQYLSAVLTKSIAVCWVTGCLLVYVLVDDACVSYTKKMYPGEEQKAYFLLFSTAMCNLRYIAFSIEYVWSHNSVSVHKNSNTSSTVIHEKRYEPMEGMRHRTTNVSKEKTVEKPSPYPIEPQDKTRPLSFIDLLMYQMYYPLFYGGPIINYDDFAEQTKRPPIIWSYTTIKNFAVGMLRYIFWHIFTDFLLHYFYAAAASKDYKLLQDLPLFNLFGVAFAQVVFFYLKYVAMYGIPSYFATSDNLDIPKGPHCVLAKHRVTDMWKYFDKGLHLWLVRYIYIPCGGSRVHFLRATLNSIIPFAFVYFWHGATHGQIYWAVLSWLGVYLESCALRIYKTSQVQYFETTYLTPAWSRRIRAFFSAPLMFLLLTSNLYFLSSTRVGNLFWRRLYYENSVATILMHLVFYAGCQSSMEFERLGL